MRLPLQIVQLALKVVHIESRLNLLASIFHYLTLTVSVESVSKIASEYGISNRTIYGWLSKKAFSSVSVVEYNRIRKENDQLKQIIGILTFEVEKLKKERSIRSYQS